MARKASIVESLRRMSKPEVLRRYSSVKLPGDNGQLEADALECDSGNKPGRCETNNRNPRATIFSLPVELQVQIWSNLSFDDICAARQACAAFKELLSEGDIPRQWTMMHFSAEQLATNPVSSPATFRGLLEQAMRARLLDNVAWKLVEYIKKDILLDNTEWQASISEEVRLSLRGVEHPGGPMRVWRQNRPSKVLPVWHKLHASLLSSLIILEHYFSQCRHILITMPNKVPQHTTAEDEFKRLSWQAVTAYSLDQIETARNCFLFLTWLTKSTLSRPSYVGRIERTLRGWVKDPVELADFHQYLALTNIQAYTELLRVKTYKERRRVIETALRQLNPATSVNWRAKWWASSTRLNEEITEKQAESALSLLFQAGMLWADGAREVLVDRGAEVDGDSDETGSPWQAMAYLNGIAGYNLLTGGHLESLTRASTFDPAPDGMRMYY